MQNEFVVLQKSTSCQQSQIEAEKQKVQELDIALQQHKENELKLTENVVKTQQENEKKIKEISQLTEKCENQKKDMIHWKDQSEKLAAQQKKHEKEVKTLQAKT